LDVLTQAEELIRLNIFQFIELTPVPGTDMTPFQALHVPYVIHGSIDQFGFNFGDRENWKVNLERVAECINWVDALNAKYCIFHPGYGSIENVSEFLSTLDDKRIIIENMPERGLHNEDMVGFTPEQIKQLVDNKFGFCLDFNHAVKASLSLGISYKTFIQDFLKLKPNLFHISDGKAGNFRDEHLAIGQGDYDFRFLRSCIDSSRSKLVTMETPRKKGSLSDDIENRKRLLF
jgi:endonuclease IV